MSSVDRLLECCEFASGLCVLGFRVTYLTLKAIIAWCVPRNHKDISEEVVLITGGGRGIGRQIALEIANCKPKHIILWGRKEQPLETTRDDVRALGVKCSYMTCDVSNKEEIYTKAQEVIKVFGPVTILINNAGVVYGKQLMNSCDNEVENTFHVNLLAHFWTVKAFLSQMMDINHGHIVSVSSLLGLMGMKGATDYCSSKFASTGLTECLKWELEDYDGIHITSVHPYQVANEMFSGMKIRFPLLMPPLSEKYVAQKTVSAVLCNRNFVIMPKLMYFVIALQRLLPVPAALSITKFLGGATAMDNVPKQRDKADKQS